MTYYYTFVHLLSQTNTLIKKHIMRSSRITSSGVVVFLLLQALSSCIRIELGHVSKYDIDKDSLFFRTMPSPSEVGADLVTLELNGTPFVFPREGNIYSSCRRIGETTNAIRTV